MRPPSCCRPCNATGLVSRRGRPALPCSSAPQASLGFLLPALVHATLEVRLFARHQQQRRRTSLAAEAGWQAAVYESLAGLLDVLAWPQAVLAVGVLLSICFYLSLATLRLA